MIPTTTKKNNTETKAMTNHTNQPSIGGAPGQPSSPSAARQPQSRNGRRKAHPARKARIMSTGVAATMTFSMFGALTLAETSAAQENAGTKTAADLISAHDIETNFPVPAKSSANPAETPTTIVVVRRVHVVPAARSSSGPISTTAKIVAKPIAFAPKAAVRSLAATKSPVKAGAKKVVKARVRAANPKVRVRKAKPATRSS
jgi:hypothetical protein